jgi:pimeloyl-ACP methyl ester carboxylesterase
MFWGSPIAWVQETFTWWDMSGVGRLRGRWPQRLQSLCVLSTPHTAALGLALKSDSDQQARSSYFRVLTAPDGGGEKYLLADDGKALRGAYLDKVPESAVDSNVRRFQGGGTLSAALNWYRAMTLNRPPGTVKVPTLYIWGDRDQALGRTAALGTAQFCTGPYRFEVLPGKSHWLLEECPEEVLSLLRDHLDSATHGSLTLAGLKAGV